MPRLMKSKQSEWPGPGSMMALTMAAVAVAAAVLGRTPAAPAIPEAGVGATPVTAATAAWCCACGREARGRVQVCAWGAGGRSCVRGLEVCAAAPHLHLHDTAGQGGRAAGNPGGAGQVAQGVAWHLHRVRQVPR